MTFDLVIRGGTLVTAADTFRADLAVQGERIAAVGHGLQGRQTLDARGMLVIPGGVDPHVHLQMPAGATTSSDDWASGTAAAACGGTTTVLSFVEPKEGESLAAAFRARRAQAEGNAAVDYGLHMTLNAHPGRLDAVPAMVEAGMPSFKVYTTYGGMKRTDGELLAAMEAVRSAGGLVMAHCENDAICAHATQKLLAQGRTAPQDYPSSRPASAEAEAIARVLALAEAAGAPVYIVHVAPARGAEALAAARARGLDASGETCPQYVLLTDAEYGRPGFEGAKFVCAPPLRTPEDQAALWEALRRGELQTVGTDHCPFNYAGQKDLGRDDFTQIPGGLPGVEFRLALMYAAGVRAGRFGVNRWVELCSTAPARRFGLYPRKGSLSPGADADIVLFDPERTGVFSHKTQHENVDYTPYEGRALHGFPAVTLSRGAVVVRGGTFTGRHGHGRYLARRPYHDMRREERRNRGEETPFAQRTF